MKTNINSNNPIISLPFKGGPGRVQTIISLPFKGGPGRVLALLLLLISTAITLQAQRILGYYPYYRAGTYNSIEFDKTTDIVYAFLNADTNGDLIYSGSFDPADFNAMITEARLQNPDIRIHISSGGWGLSSWFYPVVSDPLKLDNFVQNMADFIILNELDGWDCDWEFPSGTTEKDAHELLLQSMRTEFDLREQVICRKLEVSMAVGGDTGPGGHINYYNPSSIDHVDFVSLMAYDDGGAQNHSSMDFAMSAIHGYADIMGWPISKMMLGVPFYGRGAFGGAAETFAGIAASNPAAAYTADNMSGYYYNGMPLLADKTDSILQLGGQGITIWELAQDRMGLTWSLLDGLHSHMSSNYGIPPAAADPCLSNGAGFPFPQHIAYTNGHIKPALYSQAQLDNHVRTLYDQWKAAYLNADCGSGQFYIEHSPNTNVSEGTGYGMMITAIMAGYDVDAKTWFDGLYQFYKAHPSNINNRLMAWKQTSCVSVGGVNSATDGDIDIAFALLLADAQWGSDSDIDYATEAALMIDAIMQDDINPDTRTLKLGDWSNPSSPTHYYGTRSSDFILSHFRAFEEVSADANWGRVIDTCYSLINTIQTNYSAGTGLMPDFITHVNTTPQPAADGFLEGSHDGDYYYNACRFPWRIACDYLIYGDARARTAVDAITAWLRTSTGDDPANISNGYLLDGSPIYTWNDPAFSGAFAVGAMTDMANQDWLDALYQQILDHPFSSGGYYENSLKLLYQLVLSGNFWSPYAPEIAVCPVVDLGDDLNLCSPAEADLMPVNMEDFAAGTSWQWSRNGLDLESANAPILPGVRLSGIYQLTATPPDCPATADELTLSSSLPTPVDSCREDAGSLLLTITDEGSGPYNWYDTPDGGIALAGGSSFITPALSSTTTYYVADEGSFSATVGPPISGNGMSGVNDWLSPNKLHFDALSSFQLSGVTLRALIWFGTHTISMEIRDAANTIVPGSQRDLSLSAIGSTPAWQIVTFDPGIYIPQADGYKLIITGAVGVGHWNSPAYPMVYGENLRITGLDVAGSYLAIHDWQIEGGSGCDRLPVIAQIGGCSSTISVCEAPVNLFTDQVTSSGARLNWEPSVTAIRYQIRGSIAGTGNWSTLNIPNPLAASKTLNGLPSNKDFVWQIRSVCGEDPQLASAWSEVDTFRTGCFSPDTIWVENIQQQNVQLNWSTVYGVEGYMIRGQKLGSSGWAKVVVMDGLQGDKNVGGLDAGESYQWQVRGVCALDGSLMSGYGVVDTFATMGAPVLRLDDGVDGLGNLEWELFPNPGAELNLRYLGGEAGDVVVRVYDLLGRVVIEEVVDGVDFGRLISVDRAGRLLDGVYVVEVRVGFGVWEFVWVRE